MASPESQHKSKVAGLDDVAYPEHKQKPESTEFNEPTADTKESSAHLLPGPLDAASKTKRGTFTGIYVAVRGPVVYVIGRIGDSIVVIKAKAVETADIAQVKLASTVASLKPQLVRLKNGMLRLQGQVLSVPVLISAKMVGVYRTTTDVTLRCCQDAGDVLCRIAGPPFATACLAYSSILQATSNAASRCYITIRDGALRVQANVGGKVTCLKFSVHGLCLKLKSGSRDAFNALSTAIEVSVRAVACAAAAPFVLAKEKLQVLYCTVAKGALHMTASFGDFLVAVRFKISDFSDTPVLARVISAIQNARTKAVEASAGIRGAVTPKAQATAASAASGAVALGVSAGSAGLVAGGAVGAALGVVPAVFTFGLSIPVGAIMGSGAGLCVGTAAGGTAGFIGGGAVGYGAFSHRQGIEQLVRTTVSKADQCKEYMKDKSSASKQFVRAHLIGGTGGTPFA